MEPSAAEAQKDHKYFIMAYLRDRPVNCVRSKKIRETMTGVVEFSPHALLARAGPLGGLQGRGRACETGSMRPPPSGWLLAWELS